MDPLENKPVSDGTETLINPDAVADRPTVASTVAYVMFGVFLFAFVRSTANILVSGNPSPGHYLAYFVICVACIYGVTRMLCRMAGLSMAECRIPLPRLTLRGIFVACALPALYIFIFTRLPGQWVWRGLPPDYLTTAAYLFFFTGFCSGIIEEMLFRGFLLRRAEQTWNKPAAALFIAVVFALMHYDNVGDALFTWSRFGWMTLFSILMAMATYSAGHIWDAALLHALWDALAAHGLFVHVGPEIEPAAFINYVVTPEAQAWFMAGSFPMEKYFLMGFAVIGAGIAFYLLHMLWTKRRRGMAA